ncbi:hypothetical protein SAMD00023353_1800760 [Rosellinia necatrix]|uniref:Uncharacterized protein n=1 Tax=Rosellinia necatrix TaxID=77044 RepID=A0A1W2TE87_ROSNE|nr:hypothetical protein SAMD00023353_1800760 [Rosellinia necatrix]
MGGLAFASGPNPVFTPRMKPSVYRAVRDRCQEALRRLFVVVATPIEGPAKTSFGDIDLFVAWRREETFPHSAARTGAKLPPPKEAIFQALGAIRSKSEHAHIATLAIPWPTDIPYDGAEPATTGRVPETPAADDESARPSPSPSPCIQVDVHVCPTLELLQWMLFKHAHGDLWNVLGSTIRPLGLTIDEEALYVRVPEIEASNKKLAKVRLSAEPAEILSFLGLASDAGQWEAPFARDEDVFEYAATCRLFWVRPAHDDDNNNNNGGAGEEGTEEGPAADRRKLKSNDRRRMEYRPLFRKWIDEFLPACRAAGRSGGGGGGGGGTSATMPTRDAVRAQAFARFPGAAPAYAARLAAWRAATQRQALWRDVIKPAVPAADPGGGLEAQQRRGCCCAALKKIILAGDDGFGGIVAPPHLKRPGPGSGSGGVGNDNDDDDNDDNTLFDEDAVRAWVAANWRRVGDAAWEANRLRKEAKGPPKRTVSGQEKQSAEDAAGEVVAGAG